MLMVQRTGRSALMRRLHTPGERAWAWLIGSDPGLLRLQTAGRTTLTLAVALAALFVLSAATGQPLTVAILGVVIAMVSAMAVNDPDRRQREVTTLLLPVPAAAAVSLGSLLGPHRAAGDVAFVAILFAGTYAGRFGGRGMALGMTAIMAYYVSLLLGTSLHQLPWLIGAVLVGKACSLIMRRYVFPDRPALVLRRTLQSLWSRIGGVVDATGEALRAGVLTDRSRRRLRMRVARLNETTLMVQSQLAERVDAAMLWPGVADEDLALRLFDAELAAERLAASGEKAAAVASELPSASRAELIYALDLLRMALRHGAPADALARAEQHAEVLAHHDQGSTAGDRSAGAVSHRLALATAGMAAATNRVRVLADRDETSLAGVPNVNVEPPTGDDAGVDRRDRGDKGRPATAERTSAGERLRPSTRQAIQVAVAASLAILGGELLSSARWYWAVLAAVLVVSGTLSREETLTKGWQRLLGTALGVAAGMLIAAAVGGNLAWSTGLIFACVFGLFYFRKVSYSLMVVWSTAMLALRYGLLGQFSLGVLLLIEETGMGVAAGGIAAILVLPISTHATVRDEVRAFLITLADLVAAAAQTLVNEGVDQHLTARTRGLDQQLQRLRTSAGPLTTGFLSFGGRGSIRSGLWVLTACDHYARVLARSTAQPQGAISDPALRTIVASAAEQTGRNIDALAAKLGRRGRVTVRPATDLFDRAEQAAGGQPSGGPPAARAHNRQLLTALRALRSIDQAIVDLAHDLDAASPTADSI
jgi:uncharacterized membrane protein YccC